MLRYADYMRQRTNKAGAPAKPYHHGDLRSALLAAAELELEEKGTEAFSLRGVAKRAGVSHAAPSHHFEDVGGLLTALTAIGYERFVARMEMREKKAGDDPQARLVAAGLGYIDFAAANPALFRLMFGSKRPDFQDPALAEASGKAFTHLVQAVAGKTRTDPHKDETAMRDVMAAWAIAHGVADLLIAGRLKFLQRLPQTKREAMIAQIIDQALSA